MGTIAGNGDFDCIARKIWKIHKIERNRTNTWRFNIYLAGPVLRASHVSEAQEECLFTSF